MNDLVFVSGGNILFRAATYNPAASLSRTVPGTMVRKLRHKKIFVGRGFSRDIQGPGKLGF
jgi:hypothetical protein